MKFLYVQRFLLGFSASELFVWFLSTKIAVYWSKLTPKSWHFFCEFLVPPELPTKLQRSSMTCELPLSPYVCMSVHMSPSKKVFILLSVLLSAFFSYMDFFVHSKNFFMSAFLKKIKFSGLSENVQILSKFHLPSSYCLYFMKLWRFGGKGSRTHCLT